MQTEIDLEQLPSVLASQTDIGQLDLKKPLAVIARLISNDAKSNIQGEHDPDGKAWPPLKNPRPAKRGKGQRGRSPSGTTHLLWDTGRLIASLGAGGRNNIQKIGQFELVFGTNVEYAAYHQYGADLPARERKPEYSKSIWGSIRIGAPPYAFMVGTDSVVTWKTKAGRIPARPFLGIGDKLAEDIDGVIGRFIEESILV